MESKFMVFAVSVFLALGVTIVDVCAQSTQFQKKTDFYKTCIDKIINNCQCKAAMRDSKSKAIQRAAALAVLKAEYLRIYKNHLIQEMQSQNITLKPYKVEYYLNQKFFEIIH